MKDSQRKAMFAKKKNSGLSSKELENVNVDDERHSLEGHINEYMLKMILSSDMSIEEAKNLTARDCKVYIKRFEE